MFISDSLIYLQLHKTGCTHIENLLRQTVGGEVMGKHERLPAGSPVDGRKLLGSVRNPWDWYVSLWAYGCGGQGGLHGQLTGPRRWRGHGFRHHPALALRRLLAEAGRSASSWRRLYADVTNPALFREWVRRLHDPRYCHAVGEGYAESPIHRYGGFFTYRYALLYARDPAVLYSAEVASPAGLKGVIDQGTLLDAVIRTERLEDDLLDALRLCGVFLSEDSVALIRAGNRTNASQRSRNLSFYYDQETRELVGERDGILIAKYGYAGPEANHG